MKRTILLAFASVVSVASFAQRTKTISAVQTTHPVSATSIGQSTSTARTTATGDTIILANLSIATDTATYYGVGTNHDSGFVSGTDAYGDMGFAERYNWGTSDSSLKVIGVVTLFGGKVNPASTKTVKFYAWNVGAQVPTSRPTLLLSGLPGTPIDSVSAGVIHLGIHTVSGGQDSLKQFLFPTPTAYLNHSFFVGYTINYDYAALGGDTIALYNTTDGSRTSVPYTVVSGDTIINDQNATMYNDGTWHDNAVDNFGLYNDFYIFPICIVKVTTDVKGINNHSLTFYGNYPDPANNNTNVRFSLAAPGDVTITVTNMAGAVVKTINQSGMSAGEHTLPIETSSLPTGEYIYLVRTSTGGGVASKLTVAH
jgi:hypothetical protein